MTWIDAQALAAEHAQQDADFGVVLATLIFIAVAVALAHVMTGEQRKDRL